MRRSARSVVLAVAGWLLVLGGLLLPWTHTTPSGSHWLVEELDRHWGLVGLFGGGLAALALAVVLLALRSPPGTAFAPALAGSLTVVAVVLATPRPHTISEGVDSTGRPFRFDSETVMSAGAVSAVLGAALIMIITVHGARAPRR